MSIVPELVLGGVFTLISMAPEWANMAAPAGGAHYRVDIGLGMGFDNDDKMGFGGNIPGVALFGNLGARIAMKAGGGKQAAGGTAHLDIQSLSKDNNPPVEYISVSQARDNIDAICITHVGTTDTDGERDEYAIAVGEVAAVCNSVGHDYPWYHSSRTLQPKGVNTNDPWMPKCVMLDTPDDHGVRNSPYAGFTARLFDFKLDNSTWKSWEKDPHQ